MSFQAKTKNIINLGFSFIFIIFFEFQLLVFLILAKVNLFHQIN
jgi:hypothetical protein